MAEEAQAKKLDSGYLRIAIYQTRFYAKRQDGDGASRWPGRRAKRGWRTWLFRTEADTAAYGGQLRKARDLTRQAAASAERADEKEPGGVISRTGRPAGGPLRKFGTRQEGAAAALALSNSRDVQIHRGDGLRYRGDASKAQTLVDDFKKRFPEDTVAQFNDLPSIEASDRT